MKAERIAKKLSWQLIVCSCFLCFIAKAESVTSNWQVWQAVGQAQLTWGFWVIYDSELRTPDGTYSQDQQEMALVIRYRKNISKADLLKATNKQWKHLGFESKKRRQWLRQLESIWPDVKNGDRLIFVINPQGGAFYQDNRFLGKVENMEMARAFIGIWLSPQTAYPQLRHQLTGRIS